MKNIIKNILISIGVIGVGLILFFLIKTNNQQLTTKSSSSIVSIPESSGIAISESHPIVSTHDKEVIIEMNTSKSSADSASSAVNSSKITIQGDNFKVKIEGPSKESLPYTITIKTNPIILIKPTLAFGFMTTNFNKFPSISSSFYLRFSPLIIKQKTYPFVFVSIDGWGAGLGYKLLGNLSLDALFNLTGKRLWLGLSLKL